MLKAELTDGEINEIINYLKTLAEQRWKCLRKNTNDLSTPKRDDPDRDHFPMVLLILGIHSTV